MPGSVTADKILGKGLIAKIKVPKLNGSLQVIGEFLPGEAVGVVYSYIQRGTKLYWQIQPTFGQTYYVEHTNKSFELTDDIQNAIRKQELEREKEKRENEIEIKGAIPYYIEKYGKILILAVAGIVIIKTLIQKK
jgi:hypothetical protein